MPITICRSSHSPSIARDAANILDEIVRTSRLVYPTHESEVAAVSAVVMNTSASSVNLLLRTAEIGSTVGLVGAILESYEIAPIGRVERNYAQFWNRLALYDEQLNVVRSRRHRRRFLRVDLSHTGTSNVFYRGYASPDCTLEPGTRPRAIPSARRPVCFEVRETQGARYNLLLTESGLLAIVVGGESGTLAWCRDVSIEPAASVVEAFPPDVRPLIESIRSTIRAIFSPQVIARALRSLADQHNGRGLANRRLISARARRLGVTIEEFRALNLTSLFATMAEAANYCPPPTDAPVSSRRRWSWSSIPANVAAIMVEDLNNVASIDEVEAR
jgi:hypothetical protein